MGTARTPTGSTEGPAFVALDWAGRAVSIEHQWVGQAPASAPLMVFLHEGLGSLSMWRDFPQQLCQALGCRGLVYSRPGYGQSTPRAADERWAPDFMHRQALQVLPALLAALGVEVPVWLFGHSDGGSMALIHAARRPAQTAGVMVMAPHILVEDLSVQSIAATRQAYLSTDLRHKLARHHVDPDSAFWGWNDIWLDPAFRHWSIEAELPAIACPLLAVQGLDDEYGTLEQIRGIQRRVPHAQLLELPECSHWPHREQPARLLEGARRFFQSHGPSPSALQETLP